MTQHAARLSDLPILGHYRSGRPIYLIAGGSEPPAEPPPAGQAPPPPNPPAPAAAPPPAPVPEPPAPKPAAETRPEGYPADTPVADMTPEEQAAYWKAQSRKHEGRVKEYGSLTPDQVKALQKDEEKRRQAALSEQERKVEEAVQAATQKAKAEERELLAPQLVAAEFKATAAGRLTKQQLAVLTEDVDPQKYLTDSGAVDTAKVQRKVDAFAPAAPRMPDLGQGHREHVTEKGVAAGRERYEARKSKKSPSTTT